MRAAFAAKRASVFAESCENPGMEENVASAGTAL
jgi:hypothetical protein